MFQNNVLRGHTNIDLIYATKKPLPWNHPLLEPYLCKEALAPAACAVDIPAAHPDITAALARGDVLPSDHPSVHSMFRGDVLKGHTNVYCATPFCVNFVFVFVLAVVKVPSATPCNAIYVAPARVHTFHF
jgi:hypothetical protein